MAENNNHPVHLLHEVDAIQKGTMVFVTHYAIGRNNGGSFIRLFFEHAPLAVMSVYESELWRLPKEWEAAKEDLRTIGPKLKIKKSTPSDTEEMRDNNRLIRLTPPAYIVRYRYDEKSDDANQKRWRFHAIYNFAPHYRFFEDKDATKETIPVFNNRGDCWKWGVEQKAFADEEEASQAYLALSEKIKPQTANQMYTQWFNYVKRIVEKKEGD